MNVLHPVLGSEDTAIYKTCKSPLSWSYILVDEWMVEEKKSRVAEAGKEG